MCPAQLMLLDEPTNHLDLDALVWLEGFLTRFEGTMLVISHDREFLDAVTKVTLHLEDATLTRYAGNYSKFEEMKAERERLQQASHSRQQERIAQLTRFVERFKAKASKSRQAQSRVKALERMERIPPVLSAASFDFEFKEPANVPNPMLVGQRADLRLQRSTVRSKPILANLNRSIMAGQRIGLLGANGQGKSTLVKTIAQTLRAARRRIHAGQGLVDRLLRAAGTRRAARERLAAAAPAAAGARGRPGGDASRNCATSSAAFASPTRWPRSRSAP